MNFKVGEWYKRADTSPSEKNEVMFLGYAPGNKGYSRFVGRVTYDRYQGNISRIIEEGDYYIWGRSSLHTRLVMRHSKPLKRNTNLIPRFNLATKKAIR